jgi:hypothetical protein
MSRATRLGLSAVLLSLALSPIARSAPTTQPAVERSPRLHALEMSVVSSVEQRIAVQRTTIVNPPLQLQIPRRAWPSLRIVAPTQNPPAGWVLRNPNRNTWHYVVPVGFEF